MTIQPREGVTCSENYNFIHFNICAPVIPFTNYPRIPVSSAPVERLFSVAGILATCEGCCISHKLLEELISIKYNQFILKIKTNTFTMNYTLPTYNQINKNKHIFIYVTVYRKIGHNAAPMKIYIFALTLSSVSRY